MTIEVTKVENNFAHLRDSISYEARWILVDSREATVFGPFFASPDEAESFVAEVLNKLDEPDLARAKSDVEYLLKLRDEWRLQFQQTSIQASRWIAEFVLPGGVEEGLMVDDGSGNWGNSDYPGKVYYRTIKVSHTHSTVEEVCGETSTVLWDEVPTENLQEYLTRHYLWEVGSPFVGGSLWLWRGGPTPDIPARCDSPGGVKYI